MSFTENDRKLQSESGKSFPTDNEHARPLFVRTIALALREEFGGGPSAMLGDREFADPPVEESGFEPLVPLTLNPTNAGERDEKKRSSSC
jgi:hypothetical protein